MNTTKSSHARLSPKGVHSVADPRREPEEQSLTAIMREAGEKAYDRHVAAMSRFRAEMDELRAQALSRFLGDESEQSTEDDPDRR